MIGVLKTAVREAFALFVEDARLTVALAVWMALAAALGRWVWPATAFGAPLLFAGLAAILVENVVHTARRARRRR